MAVVYILKNKINNKHYVGQTIQKINNRISQHVRAAADNSCQVIHKAIRKYGLEKFEIETIICNGRQEDLDKLECDTIKKFNSMVPYGYNLKDGGHHGKYSKESKLKMSMAHKGKKLSVRQKDKISMSSRGNKYRLGIKHSNETKKKMSESRKGKKHSNNTKHKLSKMKLGKNNPMYGISGDKHHNSKKIIIIEPNGTEKIFGSLMDASRNYNLDFRNLSAVATGKRKHHKGYICRYAYQM